MIREREGDKYRPTDWGQIKRDNEEKFRQTWRFGSFQLAFWTAVGMPSNGKVEWPKPRPYDSFGILSQDSDLFGVWEVYGDSIWTEEDIAILEEADTAYWRAIEGSRFTELEVDEREFRLEYLERELERAWREGEVHDIELDTPARGHRKTVEMTASVCLVDGAFGGSYKLRGRWRCSRCRPNSARTVEERRHPGRRVRKHCASWKNQRLARQYQVRHEGHLRQRPVGNREEFCRAVEREELQDAFAKSEPLPPSGDDWVRLNPKYRDDDCAALELGELEQLYEDDISASSLDFWEYWENWEGDADDNRPNVDPYRREYIW